MCPPQGMRASSRSMAFFVQVAPTRIGLLSRSARLRMDPWSLRGTESRSRMSWTCSFPRELCFMELLRHLPEREITPSDLFPYLPCLLVVAGTHAQVSLMWLRSLFTRRRKARFIPKPLPAVMAVSATERTSSISMSERSGEAPLFHGETGSRFPGCPGSRPWYRRVTSGADTRRQDAYYRGFRPSSFPERSRSPWKRGHSRHMAGSPPFQRCVQGPFHPGRCTGHFLRRDRFF